MVDDDAGDDDEAAAVFLGMKSGAEGLSIDWGKLLVPDDVDRATVEDVGPTTETIVG